MGNNPIRLILAEDITLESELITEQLNDSGLFEVVAVTNSGRHAIDLYRLHKPDIALLDIGLNEINGIEACETILKEFPGAKILFMTSYDQDIILYQAYKSGCKGYISKLELPHELENALLLLSQGKTFFPQNLSDVLARYSDTAEFSGIENFRLHFILTHKEYEIFCLLGDGLSTTEIADKLGITKKTVENHILNLKDKLNSRHTNRLIALAARHKLIFNGVKN